MTNVIETDCRRSISSALPKWIVAAACVIGMFLASAVTASAETRSLKLYFVHTGEKAEITFKRNGRYDRAGLRQINRFLRDWRRNEPTNMDPRLFDVVWEAYRQSGSRAYIHVVSAYRSPATNKMLRGRSRGVAKKSQHMLGKAMDWYLPDVKLKTLRNIGLKMQAGGVGYYPRSGSPFVHFDVGRVRHWPGISRTELASVFPNGKTLHVPSDGRPLPGYEQAMSAYKVRQSKGELAVASLAKGGGKAKRSGGLLAAWFGGGADEEEDVSESEEPAQARPKTVARASRKEPDIAPARLGREEQSEIAIVPPEKARPAGRQPEITVLPPELAAPADVNREVPAEAAPVPQEPAVVEETPETIIAALPARSVPRPDFAPRPQVDVGAATTGTEVASLIEAQSTALPVEETAADSQALANVPIPGWRPDQMAVPEADSAPTLLALADPQAGSDQLAPVPSLRPAAEAVEMRGTRPGTDGAISSTDELSVAAVPTPAPTREHAVAVNQNVVTTPKAGRVTAAPAKPEPKPVVVAAAPQSARWAIDKDYVAKAKGAKKGPAYAQNIVRSAPIQVYTAGFQRSDKVTDPNRFTGKAVEFLSVAKFQ